MRVTIERAIESFPKRQAMSHKGDYGHVLVIAGSACYTGAAYLTSQATLLAGAGLVTLAVGKSIHPILASKVTEVMVRPYLETRDYSLSLLAEKDLLQLSEKCAAFAIGPGISQNRETQHLVRNIVSKATLPVVLDADGINSFVGHLDMLKAARSKLILTPHPGEMARLIGKSVDDVQNNRKDIALNFANEYNTVLILKGHATVVAQPGGACYINETGNPGMASGGVGDVLTGIIAGFLAQGCELFDAAMLGVYMHGLAGDAAAGEKGTIGLIASDILRKLPEVLKRLA